MLDPVAFFDSRSGPDADVTSRSPLGLFGDLLRDDPG